MLDWNHDSTREVDWVAGGSFVMRNKAIEKIGDFDEKYFYGFEDVDWCYRVKLAGGKVYYLNDAVIIHDLQRASKRLFSRMALNHLISGIRYYIKFKNKPLVKHKYNERIC